MTTNDATSLTWKQLDLANYCIEVQEDQDEILEHLSTPKTQNKDGKSKSSKRNKDKTKQNNKVEKQKKKNRINGETSENKQSIEHNYTNEIDSYKDEEIDTNASPQVEVKDEENEKKVILMKNTTRIKLHLKRRRLTFYQKLTEKPEMIFSQWDSLIGQKLLCHVYN